MKTKKIGVTCFMTLVLMSFIWLKPKSNIIGTDLTLSNIEALALNEGGGGSGSTHLNFQ